MQQPPLIVFAFAHERSESNPPVRNLLKEQLQVTSLVAPLVQKKYCETQAIVNVSVDRLNQLIEREGERLIGLHYASDVATLLRSREGKEKSMCQKPALRSGSSRPSCTATPLGVTMYDGLISLRKNSNPIAVSLLILSNHVLFSDKT